MTFTIELVFIDKELKNCIKKYTIKNLKKLNNEELIGIIKGLMDCWKLENKDSKERQEESKRTNQKLKEEISKLNPIKITNKIKTKMRLDAKNSVEKRFLNRILDLEKRYQNLLGAVEFPEDRFISNNLHSIGYQIKKIKKIF